MLKVAVAVVTPGAFDEVALTLHHALRELGHSSVMTKRADHPGTLNIVLGSNLLPASLSPTTVLYNLEQISPESYWVTPAFLSLLKRFPLWDFSQGNIAALRRRGITHALHVPIGWNARTPRIAKQRADIDVLFYGNVNARRQRILDAVAATGVRLVVREGCFGKTRDALIARSRIVLNLHYYRARRFEQARVTHLLSNQRFVLSEPSSEAGALAPGIAWASDIAKACERYLAKPALRAEIAARGEALFRAQPMTDILYRVLPRAL